MTTFEIKDYRQPFVTSLGVILGFLLGSLGQWITEDDFSLNSASDYLTFAGSIIGAGLLLQALFRMLKPIPKPEMAEVYYTWTLRFYVTGVLVPIVTMLIAAFV